MAWKGNHYCIDFGPSPNLIAASLKEPLEAKRRALKMVSWGRFLPQG